MAYTPENNPYIPGDPYSYDLKWLIRKIKELESYINAFPVEEIERIVREALSDGILEAVYNGSDTIELMPGAGVNDGDIVKYFQIATDIINIRDAESFEKAEKALALNGDENIIPQARIYHDAGLAGSFQGACIDGNMAYVFNTNSNDFPNGNILVYDIENHTLTNTLSGIKGYHGNDMCFRDSNNIIIAQCYADYNGNNWSKGFTQYSINSGSSAEFYPFNNIGSGGLWGVTMREGNLIAAISSGNTAAFWEYDLNNGTITPFTITNDVPNFTAAQTIDYNNGYLYVLVTGPDAILKFKVDEYALTLVKVCALPKFDGNSVQVGEYEAFKISDYPNEGDAILTSICMPYYSASAYTVQIYHINLESGNSRYHMPYNYHTPQAYERDVYINSSYTGLYENGSQAYPFKTMGRGLTASNRIQPNYTIVEPGNYTMPFMYNLKGIKLRSSGVITFDTGLSIQNSEIAIWGTNGIVVNGNITAYNSKVFMQNITLYGFLTLDRGYYQFLGMAIDRTGEASRTSVITLSACFAQIGLSGDIVSANASYWVMTSGYGMLIYNDPNNNIGTHYNSPGINWLMLKMGVTH